MRVLIVSLWYYPEPVAKPHDLASELVKRGYEVFVLTSFPNYPRGKIYPDYKVKILHREEVDGVRVFRVPGFIDRSKSSWRRILSLLSFSVTSSIAGLLFTKNIDIIWTYQVGLPGLALRKLKRAFWIHEVQDLWPDWSQTSNMGMIKWLYKLLEKQEKQIYKSADKIITISQGFKNTLIERGAPESNLQIIHNWANEDKFRPLPPDQEFAVSEGLIHRFNIMYGGNIGLAQALHIVLDAAEMLLDLEDLQFVLIGDGIERNNLIRKARKMGLKNVQFVGRQLPDKMAAYFAFAEGLLIHLMRDPVYEITIPSKTYSYLASGRPILAAVGGDVADLIQQTGAGLICNPEDPLALAQTIRKLYEMPVPERKVMGEAGREAFLKFFTRESLVDKYETLFQELVDKKQ